MVGWGRYWRVATSEPWLAVSSVASSRELALAPTNYLLPSCPSC